MDLLCKTAPASWINMQEPLFSTPSKARKRQEIRDFPRMDKRYCRFCAWHIRYDDLYVW